MARIWRDHNLKPWKVKTFKISNDPRFEEKLVDVVGLYMDPPERAVVFSFDEKTQRQALDRTQPWLPLRPGRAGTMTHDYKRNGTTDVFAALNIATGEVVTECRKRHTAGDVLAFFKKIDRSVPRYLDIHVVRVRQPTPPRRSPTGSSIPNGIAGSFISRPPVRAG